MINKTQHTNNSMQSSSTEHIEQEIQYPQYKFVVIIMLMSICGMLGTFYVFSIQEKQQFTKFKKEVQVAKQLQITDMQDRIQSYSKSHNSENLQSALPILFSNHTKLKWKGEIELQENAIATQFQEQHLELYVLDGDFYIQADEQKDILYLPILLQELQGLGLWVYGIQFLDEEEFKKENQLAKNQAEGTDSSKKKSVKNSVKKKNKKQNPQILKVSFEYPLPKWNTPTIFSEEEFLQQSFEVLAFLAYWEKFQNIRQDEKLIIQINDHLHGMMWDDTPKNNAGTNEKGNQKRTFRRHKIFDQNLLTQQGVLIEQSGLTDKMTESKPSQIQ